MARQTPMTLSDPAEWLGDWHPLAHQLGSADGLVTLASASALLRLKSIHSVSSLRQFLRNYQRRILFPLELPAIESGHGHAVRNEARELIELDCRLAQEPLLHQFAEASRRVGQYQLQKLRPLRDQRLV